MDFKYHDKTCSGLLLVLPANERTFVDDMKQFNFPESRSMKLKEVMGYDRHRVVDDNTCASDLAVFGLEHLFSNGLLGKEDFDAMIVVTQSPDYLMPSTSSVIQGRLKLKQDLFCLDICQGCAGFLVGLMQAFMMLEQDSIHRVVLINVDVLSRKVSPKDRNSYPLVGDAASITIVERGGQQDIFANLKMDGTGREALMIPAGGFRLPASSETATLEDVGDNNLRAKDHLRMDGSAVFNFVQVEVPPMIESLLTSAKVSHDDIDYYAFHQPNRFMLEKLAHKIGIPFDKMPSNIVENFGNSSGVTIPAVLAYNLKNELMNGQLRLCLAGFGVGLTWASMYMRMGNLRFCDTIDYQ